MSDASASASSSGGGGRESLIAGFVAGLCSETLMHPFDTISHRAKVKPGVGSNFLGSAGHIWRTEGLRGFFAGVSATVITAPAASAVYFTTYETAKQIGLRFSPDGRWDAAVYFASGAAAELVTSLTFVPLEVVKARLQLGANPHAATGGIVASKTNFKGVWDALSTTYRTSGLSGLTQGWQSGLVQDICFSATQFLLYELAKRWVIETRASRGRDSLLDAPLPALLQADPLASPADFRGGAGGELVVATPGAAASDSLPDELTTPETLLVGCIAGGTAAAITNPLDVITARLQCQDDSKAFGTSMRGVVRAILAKEGPSAFLRGAVPRVAQVAPLSAICFGVYEALRSYMRGTSSGSGAAGVGGVSVNVTERERDGGAPPPISPPPPSSGRRPLA